LVAGDADGYVYFYRCDGAEILQVHRAHDSAITVLHWCRRVGNSPERLLTGCRNGTVKLWDLGGREASEEGKIVHGSGRSFSRSLAVAPPQSPRASRRRNSAPRLPLAAVCSVAYSSRMSKMYVGLANGALLLFDTGSATLVSSNDTAHRGEIRQLVLLQVDPDSAPRLDRHVLDTVMKLDTSAAVKGAVPGAQAGQERIPTSSAGQILVAASVDGRVKGWNVALEGKAPLFDYNIHVVTLLTESVHPDIVFGGTAEGEVFVWQVSRAGLTTIKQIRQGPGCITAMDYNSKVDKLALATAEGNACVIADVAEQLLARGANSSGGGDSTSPLKHSTGRNRSGSIGEETVDDVLESLARPPAEEPVAGAPAPSGATGNRTDEEWLAVSQLYSIAMKLAKYDKSRSVIDRSKKKMKWWFYKKTGEVDATLAGKQQNLIDSHRSLVDASLRKERWNARRQSMIADLEARHALEKKQLLERLDDEEGALETVVPEGRRLLARAALKLKSQHLEARAFCKAEAAHIAQKTLTIIARREGQGRPVEESEATEGKALGLPPSLQRERSDTSADDGELKPGTKVKDRYLVFNRRDKGVQSFEALDMLKKQRVVVKQFPEGLPLRTDLRHPALVPLFDVCSTQKYTCIVKRWMDSSLAEYVKAEGTDNQSLPTEHVAEILYRLLEALQYIHSKGLIHRQVRPGSIFVVKQGAGRNDSDAKAVPRAYLEHFGVMPALEGTEMTEGVKKTSFAAPEMFGYAALKGSDVWGIGCVMGWLFQTPVERASSPLFQGGNGGEVLNSIASRLGCPPKSKMEEIAKKAEIPVSGRHVLTGLETKFQAYQKKQGIASDNSSRLSKMQSLSSCISRLESEESARDLLDKMLQWDPHERISTMQATQHEFFNGVRSRLLSKQEKEKDSARDV
jgi:serine/threonine protein kinase